MPPLLRLCLYDGRMCAFVPGREKKFLCWDVFFNVFYKVEDFY